MQGALSDFYLSIVGGQRGCGGSGWGLHGRGMATPRKPISVSPRAFYLERSNLPTDASTTAVKIDQVRPLRCFVGSARVAFQGHALQACHPRPGLRQASGLTAA